MKIVWVAEIAVVRGHNADISVIGIMNAGIPVRQVLFVVLNQVTNDMVTVSLDTTDLMRGAEAGAGVIAAEIVGEFHVLFSRSAF